MSPGRATGPLDQVAAEVLGFDTLRPGQEEAAAAVIDGRDALAVMPTGSGKSAIYELAGWVLDGLVVVVSPLIALQRDQVGAVRRARLGPARGINSTMSARRRSATLQAASEGRLRYVYLGPEQLANEETVTALAAGRPDLMVVDEAHCVSSWGHDFRPDYLHLAAAARALGRPPMLALTATAAPPVREEIVRLLDMDDPVVVVRGFDRPNIYLSVELHHDADGKRRALVERVGGLGRPGIVYVATRRRTEEVAADLSGTGLRAAAYHGGMAAGERDRVQDDFMADRLDVVVATTAFGMGIDKPHVSFVAHFEISDSLDSYYQEIGRAGRDGEPAAAVLLYRPEDLGLRRFFAAGGDVPAAELEAVAEALDAAGGRRCSEIAEEAGQGEAAVEAALNRLVEAGWARRLPGGTYCAVHRGSDPEEGARSAESAQDAVREAQRSRVEMMRAYAETRGCRRQFVLTYFAEPFDPPCGNCDRCDAGLVEAEPEADPAYRSGSPVEHVEWGRGEVVRLEDGDKLTVRFDRGGYKTLSLALVEEGGLLRIAGRGGG